MVPLHDRFSTVRFAIRAVWGARSDIRTIGIAMHTYNFSRFATNWSYDDIRSKIKQIGFTIVNVKTQMDI